MAEYVIGYLLMHERRLLKATLDQKAQVRDILLDQKVQMWDILAQGYARSQSPDAGTSLFYPKDYYNFLIQRFLQCDIMQGKVRGHSQNSVSANLY